MIDILFLAHKRPEFTRESLKALLANTPELESDWRTGKPTLSIYTDADPDPSYSFQLAMGTDAPIWRVNNDRHGGPVACLNDFIWKTDPKSPNEYADQPRRAPEATPEYVCKIDNDCVFPPGWLPACLDLMRRYPNVDLLGIEPWTPDEKLFPSWVEPELTPELITWNNSQPEPPYNGPIKQFGVRPVSHIGGIGVFRRSAFERFGRPVPNSQDGRFGFTEWMWANPGMVKAFIDPPLPVFLLDHLPFTPWFAYGKKYEHEGIQRNAGWMYDSVKHRALWDWWFTSRESSEKRGVDIGGPRL